MVIGGVIAFCILLLILAFLAAAPLAVPRARRSEGRSAPARRGASKAPGKLGRWFAQAVQHLLRRRSPRAAAPAGAAVRKMPF